MHAAEREHLDGPLVPGSRPPGRSVAVSSRPPLTPNRASRPPRTRPSDARETHNAHSSPRARRTPSRPERWRSRPEPTRRHPAATCRDPDAATSPTRARGSSDGSEIGPAARTSATNETAAAPNAGPGDHRADPHDHRAGPRADPHADALPAPRPPPCRPLPRSARPVALPALLRHYVDLDPTSQTPSFIAASSASTAAAIA